jgi:hypothetical protein
MTKILTLTLTAVLILTGTVGVTAATSATNTFCYDNFSNYRSFTDCVRSKYLNRTGPLNTPDKKTEPNTKKNPTATTPKPSSPLEQLKPENNIPKETKPNQENQPKNNDNQKKEDSNNDPLPPSKSTPFTTPKKELAPANNQEKKKEPQPQSTKYIAEASLSIPGRDQIIVAKCPSTSSCELYENGKFTKNYKVKLEDNELVFKLPYRVTINYNEETKKFELDKGWHPDQKTYFNQPDNSSKIYVIGRCSDFKESAIITLKTFLTNKSCMGAQQRQLLGYAQYKVKLNNNGKQSIKLVYSYATWYDAWH